jgi:hypothetical protein
MVNRWPGLSIYWLSSFPGLRSGLPTTTALKLLRLCKPWFTPFKYMERTCSRSSYHLVPAQTSVCPRRNGWECALLDQTFRIEWLVRGKDCSTYERSHLYRLKGPWLFEWVLQDSRGFFQIEVLMELRISQKISSHCSPTPSFPFQD